MEYYLHGSYNFLLNIQIPVVEWILLPEIAAPAVPLQNVSNKKYKVVKPY